MGDYAWLLYQTQLVKKVSKLGKKYNMCTNSVNLQAFTRIRFPKVLYFKFVSIVTFKVIFQMLRNYKQRSIGVYPLKYQATTSSSIVCKGSKIVRIPLRLQWSFMTIFHHKFLTRESRGLVNGWTHPLSTAIFVYLSIRSVIQKVTIVTFNTIWHQTLYLV